MASSTPTTTPPQDSISETRGTDTETDPLTSFFSDILKPGSSLHPAFQLAVDGAFAALVCVLLACAIVTRGNVHFLVLMGVSLGLWGSVKWFVIELKKVKEEESQKQTQNGNGDGGREKKDS